MIPRATIRLLSALLVTATALVAVDGIWAKDLYVDNIAGSDRFDGRTPRAQKGSGPCRSIQRALDLARKGDRIVVAKTSKPYRESLSVQAGRHTGSFDEPFVIVGNGAVLDGSAPIPEEAWSHHRGDIHRFRPRKLSHQQLFLNDRPLERVHVPATLLAAFPELKPLQWCLYEGQVYFHAEPGKLPYQYALTHTALLTGITLYEVRSVRVEDFVVQGFVFDGVNAHDSAMDVELRYLTCRGNGRSGISIGGSSRVRVRGCVLGANAEAQVRIRDFTRVSISHTKLFEGLHAPAIDRQGGSLDFQPLEE